MSLSGQRAPSHLKLKLFTEEKNCLPNYHCTVASWFEMCINLKNI